MRNVLGLLICLYSVFVLTCPSSYAVEDAILVVVNDDVITMNDLKDYIDTQVAQMKLEGASAQEIQAYMQEMEKSGLDRIIADKLILNAANKKDIKVEDELVDRRLADIKTQYQSEDEFTKALVEEGVSISDIRKKITNQIKIKRIIDQEIRAKIYVSPADVSEEYKNHFEDYQKPERINLDSIFVAKDKESQETAKSKIDEAYDKLKSGTDFKTVAQEYSEAPSIGIMKKGSMLPEIENAIFNLNSEEYTPVIEVNNGYYIFKLLGRSPKELSSISEANAQIYDKLFRRKFQQKFDAWLNKLKKEAFIDIKKHF